MELRNNNLHGRWLIKPSTQNGRETPPLGQVGRMPLCHQKKWPQEANFYTTHTVPVYTLEHPGNG